MVTIRPFRPIAATANAAVTAGSTAITIVGAPVGTAAVRLLNNGSAVVFITIQDTSTVAATTTTSVPMLPNSVETFEITNDNQFVSVISTTTGNTLYVTLGTSA